MRDVCCAGCEVELLSNCVSCVVLGEDGYGYERTKRAFSRQVTTSSGNLSDMVGFWESAECCQLSGGCASAIVSLSCRSRDSCSVL